MENMNRPLEGVKVVELATFVAAPSCARYLADLGADVIKVEAPSREPLRGTAINEGRPLGDYESLKARFPKLVYGSITGYGNKGPDEDLPGFDFTSFFTRGGVMGTMMDKDSMVPVQGFGDNQVAMNLASGLVAALYRAARTGKGDKVTVSLFHSAIWDVSIPLQASQYGAVGAQFPISRKHAPNLFQISQKTSDGRWFQPAVPPYDARYDDFVTCIGRPDLIGDERFYPQSNAQAHLEELYDLLAGEFAKHPLASLGYTEEQVKAMLGSGAAHPEPKKG